jgi:hypothetical protein
MKYRYYISSALLQGDRVPNNRARILAGSPGPSSARRMITIEASVLI